MSDPVIAAPGGFVPAQAMMFGTMNAEPVAVDASHPLPVIDVTAAASSTPLAGTAAASMTAGPFAPQLGRSIWLSLAGSWSGSATLLRSTDGGATRLPLTVAGEPWGSFTANANEVVVEESDAAATYYLALTVASGTIAYRVAQ